MTRTHRLLAALAAILMLGGLAACSSSSDDSTPTSSSGAAGGFSPVSIDNIFGTTTIQTEPKRVVVLGVTDSDPVLALGVVPVAVKPYTFYGQTGVGPWAQPYLQGQQLQVLDPAADVNVEEVAALAPDLIVGVSAGFDQAVYDKLAAVAPTLARPAGSKAFGVSRDDATRSIAKALGKTAQGEDLITAANAAFDQAKAANPQFAGATGAVLLPFSGQYGAYTDADARGQVMTQLGFRLPDGLAAQDAGDSFYVPLSQEQLQLADGQALVVLTDAASKPVVDADQVLQGLPVVQQGGLVLPDADLRGAMTYNTVLSAPYAVQNLAPLLAKALAATAG